MKILHINTSDIIGGAGIAAYRLHRYLNEYSSIQSTLLVGIKASNDNDVHKILKTKFGYYGNRLFHRLNVKRGKDGLSAIGNPRTLRQLIINSDIVHLHNVHGGFFSLPRIMRLAYKKPLIWTLHDMWGYTGGCCFSYECREFLNGCSTPVGHNCNHKEANKIWKRKNVVYESTKINIIISSKSIMKDVENSPLMSHFKLNYIPFGIDLKIFNRVESKDAKMALGISPESIVLGFRSSSDKQKGLSYIIDSLSRLNTKQNICLLVLGEKGLVDILKKRFKVVELGLVMQENIMAQAYNAMDIFLMPSLSESFGLMAMESMACGTPVVAFDLDVLAETLFAPKGGITVPKGDALALKDQIEHLIKEPHKRLDIGNKGHYIAINNYGFNTFIQKVVNIYKDSLK